jgi:hypothetical protein
MPLIETLTANVAASVGKAVLKVWLKDDGLVGAAQGVVDTLKKQTDDYVTARSTNRLFQNLEDDIARRMEQWIVREFPGLGEGDRNAAATAAGTALASLDLNRSLMESDLDATRLETAVCEAAPEAFSGLGKPAEELGRRLLNECCNYVVRLAGKLPDFQAASTAELLKRDREILDDLQLVLDELDRLRSERRQDVADRNTEFEDQYRRTLIQRLDYNKLFGLRLVGAGARSEQLTDTYVPQTLVDEGSAEAQSLELAVGASRLLLIRGEAGFGKTTLMQWLAVQAARRALVGPIARWNHGVPFYLRLRDWRNSENAFPAPEKFLVGSLFQNLVATMPRQTWTHDILRQGALVLVDGVDEIPTGPRRDLFGWLKGLIEDFPKASFVVSSRPAALDAEDPVPLGLELKQLGFRSLTLEPMTIYDSLALVSRWHAAVARDFVDPEGLTQLASNERALAQTIRERAAIRNLAANPLLCAMMCALNWERRQNLPDDRMELYRVALEILLERRESERKIGPTYVEELDRKSKETLLDYLAYYMLRNYESELTREKAEETIQQTLPRLAHLKEPPTTLLQELLERTGVLRQPEHGRVDFIHRTFMEYMGARAAVSMHDYGLMVDRAREESWREVIVFAAGHAIQNDRDELIRKLLKPPWLRSWSIDAQVTTICCLETVRRNLEPGLLEQLHTLAKKLFPPADFASARLLAPAAEAHPELLENHHNRSVAEIAACIRTASIIGGERMLRVVEGYAQVEGEEIDRELVRDWSAFEELAFENRVIARRDSIFGVRISELAEEESECLKVLLLAKPTSSTAKHLSEWLRDFTTKGFLSVAQNSWYSNESTADKDDSEPAAARTQEAKQRRSFGLALGSTILKRLAKFRSLRYLNLGEIEPSAVQSLQSLSQLQALSLFLGEQPDLEPIAHLPNLARLSIGGKGIVALDTCRKLNGLTRVDVYNAPYYEKIDFVPPTSGLHSVLLEGLGIANLTPLCDARNLKTLLLTALGIEDFTPLTRLHELEDLSIWNPRRDTRIPYAQLLRLRRLSLVNVTPFFYGGIANCLGIEDLEIFTSLFPDLLLGNLHFLPQIKRLSIGGSRFSCSHVGPTVQHLTFTEGYPFDTELLSELPRLESVTLHNCAGDFTNSVVKRMKERGVIFNIN